MIEIGQSVVTREPVEVDDASASSFLADVGNRLFYQTVSSKDRMICHLYL